MGSLFEIRRLGPCNIPSPLRLNKDAGHTIHFASDDERVLYNIDVAVPGQNSFSPLDASTLRS